MSSRNLFKQRLVVAGLIGAALMSRPSFGQTTEATNREQLEALSPSEKRSLVLKKERFDQLTDAEQDRLRRLDEQIRNHPRADELQRVLAAYGKWLATLESRERADLSELASMERLNRIVELRQEEYDHRLAKHGLTTRDAKLVFEWWDRTVDSREELMMEHVDAEDRANLDRMREGDPRRSAMLRMSIWRSLEKVLAEIPQDDKSRLALQLDQPAQDRFQKLASAAAQTELLERWIRESIRYEMRPPTASDEDCLSMMARLPEPERKRLEKLPRDEMIQQLRELWDTHQMWRGGPRGFRRGFDRRRNDSRGDSEGRPPSGRRRRPDDRDRGRRDDWDGPREPPPPFAPGPDRERSDSGPPADAEREPIDPQPPDAPDAS